MCFLRNVVVGPRCRSSRPSGGANESRLPPEVCRIRRVREVEPIGMAGAPVTGGINFHDPTSLDSNGVRGRSRCGRPADAPCLPGASGRRTCLAVLAGRRRQAGDGPRPGRDLRRADRADRAVLDGARPAGEDCPQRHHPQFEGIRTLCLLSLLFGGLLWPLAWLWAYSRPVLYKMAYGVDKLPPGDAGPPRMTRRRRRPPPSTIGWRGWKRSVPATELEALRADLAALEAKVAARAREVA